MIMATPTVIPDKKDVSKVTGKHPVLLDKPVREHYNDYGNTYCDTRQERREQGNRKTPGAVGQAD